MLRHRQADDRVTGLVIGGELLLLLVHDHRAALGAHHDLVLGALELVHRHGATVGARGEQRRLVDEVGEIGAGEARRAARDDLRLHVLGQRQLAHVHLEDLLAAAHVRQRHDDLAVEAARAQQRRVEHVGAVGRGDDDDAFVALEAVHLDQQLVQRLLALVVTAAEAGAAMTADRVDFVDEDDARRVLLRLLEHVAHARGADADEHLDEVGAGDREERHLGLAGDGARQQRLAGAGRADHQHAARNLAAEALELARVLEELDDLDDFFLRLVDAGDVGERDLHLVLAEQPRPALAERHGAAAARAALHLAHEVHPDGDQQQDRERGDEQLHQERLPLGRRAVELHAVSAAACRSARSCRSRGCRRRTARRSCARPSMIVVAC